jgi:hypothetical protein
MGPRGKVPSARAWRCGRKGNCISRWFPRGNNMASCTFHAHSMHPSVLIPPAVETSKSDYILCYSTPMRGAFGKTFLRLLCGATLIPAELLSMILLSSACLPEPSLVASMHLFCRTPFESCSSSLSPRGRPPITPVLWRN